jgi:hypothetical protein
MPGCCAVPAGGAAQQGRRLMPCASGWPGPRPSSSRVEPLPAPPGPRLPAPDVGQVIAAMPVLPGHGVAQVHQRVLALALVPASPPLDCPEESLHCLLPLPAPFAACVRDAHQRCPEAALAACHRSMGVCHAWRGQAGFKALLRGAGRGAGVGRCQEPHQGPRARAGAVRHCPAPVRQQPCSRRCPALSGLVPHWPETVPDGGASGSWRA